MDRETRQIKTPIGGQTVVIKAWLTGLEKRKVQNVFLEAMQIEGVVAGEKPNVKLTPEIADKAQDIAFETVIISIDDKTDNLAQRVLEMRSQDYDFVVSEINKVTSLDEQVKKN